jgi:3-oxoacyl-[acyl-carrier protein] reductase
MSTHALKPAHQLRLQPEGVPAPLALVTGASRRTGIGPATCRRLAERGYDIFFTHWGAFDGAMPWGEDADGPALLAEDLAAVGIQVAHTAFELSGRDAASELLDRVERDMGRPVSILVNNAAFFAEDSWQTIDARVLDDHFAVNVRANFLLAAEVCRRLPRDRAGRIISMSSGQFHGPMTGELAYGATKGAQDAFTISLAAEVAHLGITVNAVNPGPVDSGWMNDEIKAELTPKFPMGRVGEPDDPARLIAFLASDDARWITGQIISTEGGFLRV